ncbi:hypothetical protein RBSH_02293 [Rhodopirellula baltica SH28]|uniref:Uncharacterized protein n=1 Tax=Rhodopirellula baltica SH28 TaxID=993517 RepID=K5DHS9_RHOBT|nr:hypothetical protein RBSH_02293 [Rhodopirellula baltica SH28]
MIGEVAFAAHMTDEIRVRPFKCPGRLRQPIIDPEEICHRAH